MTDTEKKNKSNFKLQKYNLKITNIAFFIEKGVASSLLFSIFFIFWFIYLFIYFFLKNVIFFQTIIRFVLSRKIINIYNNLAQKHGNVRVKDFCKYKKLEYKKNKLKLDIDFLYNCKQLGVYLKFLIFKLTNVSNKDLSSIRKILLRSTINNHNKELQHVLKELSTYENFISKSFLLLTSTSLKNL